jgi:hypothetical protein
MHHNIQNRIERHTRLRAVFPRPLILEDIAGAIWAEFVRPFKVSIKGGSHGQSRGTFRSHSSLSMSGLRPSHVFSNHEMERNLEETDARSLSSAAIVDGLGLK